MTVQTLLVIPEGYGITSDPRNSTAGSNGNLYVICRVLWWTGGDVCRSSVCACPGSDNPRFQFTQALPVSLTRTLVERMKNNLMVVEVWDKKKTARDDKVVHSYFLHFNIFIVLE